MEKTHPFETWEITYKPSFSTMIQHLCNTTLFFPINQVFKIDRNTDNKNTLA